MTEESSPLADAIAVMTAWTDNDYSNDFAVDTMLAIVREGGPTEEFDRLLKLALGLLNLSGHLLIEMETVARIAPREVLQQIAQRDV